MKQTVKSAYALLSLVHLARRVAAAPTLVAAIGGGCILGGTAT